MFYYLPAVKNTLAGHKINELQYCFKLVLPQILYNFFFVFLDNYIYYRTIVLRNKCKTR